MAINSDGPEGDDSASAGAVRPEPPAGTDGEVNELVRAGSYGDAAALARQRGEHARAAELYERIWEFALAADAARDSGDLGRALRNAIDARDETRVKDIASALDASGASGLATAMQVFAARRRFAEAAARAEALGDIDAAIEHYRHAHRDLDAARLLEQVGRDREAGRVLERLLEIGGAPGDEAAARLRLGRILLGRMSYEEAAAHLQEAARSESTRAEAQRALVLALASMGLRDAARDVLVAARTHDPGLPADIDVFLRAERDAQAGQPARERDAEQVIGGRYRLGELMGVGSAGRVLRARDEVGGRDCAVKILHVTQTRGHQAFERFVREARIAGALRHPNLVEVYEVAADHGYLVMELMTGSLRQRLAQGPFSAVAARRLVLDVLGGLELAHQRGVIHRDVKPDNVFFDARGTAKLGDFGVAHLLDLGQTQTGGLIGTLAYMAPEQITGAPLTIAADLYSLGVTLFEALTGRLPFLGPDFVAQHLGETPPEPSAVRPDVAPGWDAIVGRLLRKSPGERYAAIDELRRDIEDLVLGDAGGPRVLILGRASAPAGTEPSTEPALAEATSAAPDESPRYQLESPLGRTDISEIARAVDTVLGRSVLIERFTGGMDEATEQRLHALARGGGPFLQRALSYDRAAAVAVFEAPAGKPIIEAFAPAPPGPRRAIRLLGRLARAVAPVHDSHSAHGALRDTTIVVDDDDIPTVLVCGLGRAVAATPESDVAAILDMVARVVRVPGGGAAVLAHLGASVPADERAALLSRGPARTGEELYALADALESAVLRARAALR